MSNIWNILAPIRTGIISLNGSGQQLFGTVVKHAINQKTITVRVSAQHWNFKYKKYQYSHKNKQVHDQYNYCVTGDKVIIHSMNKVSKSKAYFVKNIIKPFGRSDYQLETPQRVVDSFVEIEQRKQAKLDKKDERKLNRKLQAQKKISKAELKKPKKQQNKQVKQQLVGQIISEEQQKIEITK